MPANKVTGITVGTVIAFVAPGFITLGAAAYHVPMAEAWITAAAHSDQNVGVFFFILLASLSLGVVVSGIRALILDPIYFRGLRWVKPIKRPEVKVGMLAEPSRLAAFEGAVEGYYKYYQFYANSFIALVVFLLAHATAPGASPWTMVYWGILILALLALFFSARIELSRYSRALDELFSPSQERPR